MMDEKETIESQSTDDVQEEGSTTLYERNQRPRCSMLMATFAASAIIIGTLAVVGTCLSSNEKSSSNVNSKWNKPDNGYDIDDPSRIIGGNPSYQNKFPYYVDTGNCGGALIAPKVVISAAHCGPSEYGDRVIVNGWKRGDVGTYGRLVTWSQFLVHPGYQQSQFGSTNDFALYLLDESMAGLPMAALNQDPIFPKDDANVVALGNGLQNRGSQLVRGTFLHDVVIKVINDDECREELGSGFKADVMLCAGKIGKGFCFGDSGSPLVVRNGNRDTLVGIASILGNLECSKFHEYDNIFARASAAFPWVRSVVCDEWGEKAPFCPGAGAGCSDDPGWTDPQQYNCGAYAYTEGTGVPICEYHKSMQGSNGLTPIQACCVCRYVNGVSNANGSGNTNGSGNNPNPTISQCSDSPGWTDSKGYNCAAYGSTEASGVPICEYHKSIPGANGLTPVQACCFCRYVNGGSNTNVGGNNPTPTSQCSDSPGWTDPKGYNCPAYAATEASGVPICEYHKSIPGANGLTPVQACCICRYAA